MVVSEEVDQREEAGRVEETVPEQRPPRQREHSFREDRAHADHEENVEDSRADNGADADIVERYEDANYAREELGRGAAGCHKCGARHVVGNVQLLDDDVQRRHEEFVTDDGERDKHIDHA